MKILLCDQVIETTPNEFDPDVQVIRYGDQTFDELCEFIRQQIAIVNNASEPVDFAIVLNGKLAEVFPFFDGTIVSDFFKELGFASISFFGDKFELTQEYIDYFSVLQQELEINVYYADKVGHLRRTRTRPDSLAPRSVRPNRGGRLPNFFAVEPRKYVSGDKNEGLFNPCNSGCQDDKDYFTDPDSAPKYYRLKGDLTIDNTENYQNPINLDDGLSFDGGGHTITLTSSTSVSYYFGGLFSTKKVGLSSNIRVSIFNVNIKVDTEHMVLDDGRGWLCGGIIIIPNESNVQCIIDNCHVCAVLNGYYQGGFVGGSSLSEAKNSTFVIQNCSFTGDITGYVCGGIVAGDSFFANENTTMTIQNCRFAGNINGFGCGGIAGEDCFNENIKNTIKIQNCCAVGDISGEYCGGIVAEESLSHNNDTTITIQNCHTTGNVNGTKNAGCIGPYNLYENDNTKITVQDCSFVGEIYGYQNSGINGIGCFGDSANNTTITIQNCCATGDITGEFHAGIVGVDCFYQSGINDRTDPASPDITVVIQDCNYSGNIAGNGNGGVVGYKCFNFYGSGSRSGTSSDIITIQNCRSLGNILGTSNSGIVGANSFENTSAIITIRNNSFAGDVSDVILQGTGLENETDNNSGIVGAIGFNRATADSTIEIYNCLVSGDITGSGWGGVVGTNSFHNTLSSNTIHDCYSFCNFTINSELCGGILGPFCGSNGFSPVNINNCYSTGTNLGQNITSNPDSASFAIVGLDTVNCIVSNSVYNSYYQTTAGPKKINDNNSYNNVIGTPNITGRATCNNPDTVQIGYTQYGCPLHPKLSNPASYQKQYKDLNVVAAFSICKPLSVCNILAFVLVNVCRSEQLYIYSKDMKFKGQLQWDNNNLLYNGTLASGTYIIATRKH